MEKQEELIADELAQEQKERELNSRDIVEDITLSEIESVKEAVSSLTSTPTEIEREKLEELKVDFEELKDVNCGNYFKYSNEFLGR